MELNPFGRTEPLTHCTLAVSIDEQTQRINIEGELIGAYAFTTPTREKQSDSAPQHMGK